MRELLVIVYAVIVISFAYPPLSIPAELPPYIIVKNS